MSRSIDRVRRPDCPQARGPIHRTRVGLLLRACLLSVGLVLTGGAGGQQGAAIESVTVVSRPGGGAGTPVWVIGDRIAIVVRYSTDLPVQANATLKIELDGRGDGRAVTRDAACGVDREDIRSLVCAYTVAEGDEGTGVSVRARAGALTGSGLPTTRFEQGDVHGSADEVDGVRLALADDGVRVRALDADGADVSGRGGARAGEVLEVTLRFADGEEPQRAGGFGVYLVLDNARRPMVRAPGGAGEFAFRYEVVPGDVARVLTLELAGADVLMDRNGNAGLAGGEDVNARFSPGALRRVDTQGPRIRAMRIDGAPRSGAYVADASIDDADTDIGFVVEFSENVVAAPGAVSLGVQVGSGTGAPTRSVPCVAAAAAALRCTLAVEAGWEDPDGVATPDSPLVFGATDLVDDLGNAADSRFGAMRFPDHRIDTVPPEIVRTGVVTPDARAGENVGVEFTFSEEVVQRSGRSRLTLSIEGGAQAVPATFVRLAGRTLEFRYTLSQEDVDGGEAGESREVSLGRLDGPFHDLHGNRVPTSPGATEVEYPLPTPPVRPLRLLAEADRGDSVFRGIERTFLIDPPASGRYGLAAPNNRVSFGLLFGEATKFSGSVEFVFSIGGTERRVSTIGGSGTSLWTASYDIRPEDTGPIAAGELRLNPPSDVLDLADNGYENPKGVAQPRGNVVEREALHLPPLEGPPAEVDTEAPSVTGVTFLPTPAPTRVGADGLRYYGAGETIEIQVSMSEAVRVRKAGAAAALTLLVDGATDARASFRELRGDRHLIYEYTVKPEHVDRTGIGLGALSRAAMGLSVEDLAGNPGEFDHGAVASAAHRVDGTLVGEGPGLRPDGAQPIAPVDAIARVVDASDRPASGYHRAGDGIEIRIELDPPVTFTTPLRLLLAFDRGGHGCAELEAQEPPGEAVAWLSFRCRIEAGDEDHDGVEAGLSGGLTADGRAVRLDAFALPSPLRVDARPPRIEDVSITSEGGYVEGDEVEVTVTISEPVRVTAGAPFLPLRIGDAVRRASLVAPSSGEADVFVFRYVVAAGDADAVSVPALVGGSFGAGAVVVDVGGNDLVVRHAGIGALPAHVVDTTPPAVAALAITSRPAAGDGYRAGESIDVTVRFDEAVALAGTPVLGISLGDLRRDAACVANGPDALTCSYEVVEADFDADGIAIGRDALAGTLTDLLGNPAGVSHPALPDDPLHKVYGAPPAVEAVIPAMRLAAGGQVRSVDLARVFRGALLSYSASASDPSVVRVEVTGATLAVRSGVEGAATISVVARNPAGTAEATFSVEVATDALETSVLNEALAAIGRGMLSGTGSVIASRFDLASPAVAIGGQPMTPVATSTAPARRWGRQSPLDPNDMLSARGARDDSRLDPVRLLTGSGFSMPLGVAGQASFGAWGAGDLRRFEGEPDSGTYDGHARAAYLGVDARGDKWLAGVSVSRTAADADYAFSGEVQGRGTLEMTLTGVHPYMRLQVGGATELWVIGGMGSGDADLERAHVDGADVGELSMAMAIGGLKRALALDWAGASFALRGDAGFLTLETEGGAGALVGLSANVSRLRVALEAAWETDDMTPFAEVAGRFDGGDGLTGTGLELAGGVRLARSASGFGLEARGRLLALHTGEGYRETGVSVTASYEPHGNGRGVSLRLSPRWGGVADATDLFWSEAGGSGPAFGTRHHGPGQHRGWGVGAVLGYGLHFEALPGLVTPFGEVDAAGDHGRRVRFGVRFSEVRAGRLLRMDAAVEHVGGGRHRTPEARFLTSAEARF